MRSYCSLFRMLCLSILFFCSGPPAALAGPIPLPTYNIDIRQTSVSGLSSGAFMAVQFDVAFSSIMRGAGVIAGGPYYCAKGSVQTAQGACMAASSPINVNGLIKITDQNAASGSIDATGNLAGQRIWLFSGTQDSTVKQSVENDLQTYYQHYVGAGAIFYKNNVAAGHAMPTDFFGNPCSATKDPFINNCAYDAAGELLKWIYGNLNPPTGGNLGGTFIEFDQAQFIPNPNSHSMAKTGWVYAPDACQKGQSCKLHIVFHGCKQYPSYQYFSGGGMTTFGRTYVDNTGYNRWADSNNIVVLYPQTTNGNGNPNGCWDWWGYDDANYALKSGRQMAAVKAMADRMASPTLPAPRDLSAGPVTDSSVALRWSVVSGAAGYDVYRNGGRVNPNPVTDASFTDTGLAPGTPYAYQVRAVDASGHEGAASATASATTSGQAPAVPAPAGLAAGAVTSSSVALTWNPAANVAGYNVWYRTTAVGAVYAQANQNLIRATDYTVGGLQPGTAYQFAAQSQDAAGATSPNSDAVTATTSAPMACFTASNFDHVRAGRAHARAGLAYANGSNAKMGLNNTFFTTTLKQTGANFYVIDALTCP